MKKQSKGITLVALVITIIILLILAGITISQLTGNGLFENAKLAKQKYENAQEYEQEQLDKYMDSINGKNLPENTTDTDIEIDTETSVQKELLYLATTGNQYIYTGVVPNQDTKVEIKFQLLSTKAQFMYGSRKTLESKSYCLAYGSKESQSGFRSDYNTVQKIVSTEYSEIYTMKSDKNNFYINDNLIYSHTYKEFSSPNELVLFNTDTNGSINNSYCAEIRFYHCKIWDGDSLVRELIPVIDNEGVVCVYDKVEQKLYYAEYGSEEEEFLSDTEFEQRMAIATTSKQYVDTGIKPNQDTTVEMKCKLNSSSDQFFFGARTGSKSKTFSCCYLSNAIRFDYNTVQTSCKSYSVGNIYTIKQAKNSFYINDNLVGSTTEGTFDGDYNLYLFATNTARNSIV